jgi:hypothetical protein
MKTIKSSARLNPCESVLENGGGHNFRNLCKAQKLLG